MPEATTGKCTVRQLGKATLTFPCKRRGEEACKHTTLVLQYTGGESISRGPLGSVRYLPANSGRLWFPSLRIPSLPPSFYFSSLSANMAYSLYHVQMANAWKERVNKEDLRAEQASAVAAMLAKVRNKHAPQAGTPEGTGSSNEE